jgi:DNA repair protein RadC
MPICEWPIHERPREKLLNQGPQALSNMELLAIFIRTGRSGASALDLAQQLLCAFGSLKEIMDASFDRFQSIKGLGLAKYSELQAVLELSQRYHYEALKDLDILKNTHMAKKFLITKLGRKTQEVFAVICLDTQNRVIHYQELFFGTLDQASVYPREILKHALDKHAANLILAHNHPSGITQPSLDDCRLTQDIQKACHYLDIKILDHIVVGKESCSSFAELGLLQQEIS